MKKITVIAIIACAAMFASCKSQPTEEVAPVEEEVVVEEVSEEAAQDSTAAETVEATEVVAE